MKAGTTLCRAVHSQLLWVSEGGRERELERELEGRQAGRRAWQADFECRNRALGPSPAGPRCPWPLPQRLRLGLGSPQGREGPPRMELLPFVAAET